MLIVEKSNKEDEYMKKDNIKVTPEVLLLTAILGVPTGEVKKDGVVRDFIL